MLQSNSVNEVPFNLQIVHKPSFWGSAYSIIGKTMTVYEDEDDYGLGTRLPYDWDSKEFGSKGPRIACCTIE